MAPQIEKLAADGIPVMAHIGFTPQAEHQLGGYRVQGRGDAAQELPDTAHAIGAADAFAVVLEMVAGEAAAAITEALSIPTIGIGAGADCDTQVLVWQDMAGLRGGQMPRLVRQCADLRSALLEAARAYASDVESGAFPATAPRTARVTAYRRRFGGRHSATRPSAMTPVTAIAAMSGCQRAGSNCSPTMSAMMTIAMTAPR